MFATIKRAGALIAVVSVFLILCSCSTQTSTVVKPGTPAFFWGAARETYAAGDYTKALEHLDNLISTENEYTARALPWSLVLTAGASAGYMEVADAYEAGV